MKNKFLKGFTIIELLVVIAIIAVLAAVVLVNIAGYINKSKDTTARSDITNLLNNAINFYTTNSMKFDGIKDQATTSDYAKTISALDKLGYKSSDSTLSVTCDLSDDCKAVSSGTTQQKWCALIKLKEGATTSTANTFCVDSSGQKIEKIGGGTCTKGECSI